MDGTEGSPQSSQLGAALVALALAIGTPAHAAWDGTQQIELGDRVHATFAAAPGSETHDYVFYAPDGTALSLSWKTTEGEVFDVRVLDPELQAIDTTGHLKGHQIKRLPLPTRGRHTIEVQTTAGAGGYSLRTSGKYPRSWGGKNIVTPPTGNFEFEIGLPAGTRLSAKVKKSRGSAATPSFVSLSGPEGFVDLGAHDPDEFKNVPITATGLFTLAVAGGNGAAIDLTIKPKLAVGDTVFTFGAVEPTLGTATDIRTAWLGSAHADLTSEPFAHWNDESPAVVPRELRQVPQRPRLPGFPRRAREPARRPARDRAHVEPERSGAVARAGAGRVGPVAGRHDGQLRRLPQRRHGAS